MLPSGGSESIPLTGNVTSGEVWNRFNELRVVFIIWS